jgi:hypothetical protein
MMRMDGWGVDGAWVAAWGACGSGCKYLAVRESRSYPAHAVGKGKRRGLTTSLRGGGEEGGGELVVVLGGVRANLP